MNKPSAKFAVGIDLGTTNSVIAYTALANADGEPAPPQVLPIPQLTAASTVEARSVLPSFLYLAADAEKASKAYDLPWAKGRDYAVGQLAQKQSADVPTRTVAGAKSWLAYPKVDRRAPILPWNAPADVPKVSPVEASRRYVEHIVATWNAAHPDAPLKEQQVVLTVPASFDAAARDLTREAAIAGGLPDDFVLLEEPQAGLYAWLADQGKNWRKHLKVGDTLLVCDVGGGTTDFTLIGVAEENGELTLRRIAVGNHTLVGGDNMDLALAHHATTQFAAKGTNLNPWQSVALWHSCRQAKEALLGPDAPKKHPVTVLGRGSKLIGGTVSVDLDAKGVRELLLDGFFPQCALIDRPARRPASGFREIGLPYETDAAVTKHLAYFLSTNAPQQAGAEHAGSARSAAPDAGAARPTHILFNGGVFKAPALRDRLLDVMSSWFGKSNSITVLGGAADLDYAVARGAAYYAAAKTGKGVRIRGGTARAYYVGIETAGLAIPGAPRPLRALCVVPFGMEEGTQTDVPSGDIGLVVGEPATFRFFSSPTRRQDKPGDLVESWTEDQIQETDSLEADLPSAENSDEGYVPVKFQSKLTELGVFELWCLSQAADQRWKLEFSVREQS